ncbi:MAG: helix-turn-helix domain-containing protein [Lachnospiraceae bacterium]|nr:helix-turn-helix domain-containing protein [Lachnospiraceae bacterium]
MTQNDYENLGGKIKGLRIQMNLTQAEVASALDVTPGYISNVENNRSAMSLRILIYYAKLMGISLDTLIGEIDSEYKPVALDREIMNELSQMDTDTKEKVLQTIRLWKNS